MGLIDAISKVAKGAVDRLADAGEKETKPEEHKEEKAKGPDTPAPQADAAAGGEAVQPDAPVDNSNSNAPSSAIANAKEGKTQLPKDKKGVAASRQEKVDAKPEADRPAAQEDLDADVEQANLNVELAIQDATDGKSESDLGERAGTEEDDFEAAQENRGLKATGKMSDGERALVAEALAEEQRRFEEAENEALAGTTPAGGDAPDASGLSVEERTVLYLNLTAQESLLLRERQVITGSGLHEDADSDNEELHRINSAAINEEAGTEVEGDDILARIDTIDSELEEVNADKDRLAATFSAADLAAVGAMTEIETEGADGAPGRTIPIDPELKTNLSNHVYAVGGPAAEHEAVVDPTTGEPVIDPTTGEPVVPGTGAAGTTEVPINYGDGSQDAAILDAAAASGAIDPDARGQFSFAPTGELVYSIQRGEGYWQAVDHVNVQPEGMNFNQQWSATWNENASRLGRTGANSDLVFTGEPITIAGWNRDSLAGTLVSVGALPATTTVAVPGTDPQDPAGDDPAGAGDGETVIVEGAGLNAYQVGEGTPTGATVRIVIPPHTTTDVQAVVPEGGGTPTVRAGQSLPLDETLANGQTTPYRSNYDGGKIIGNPTDAPIELVLNLTATGTTITGFQIDSEESPDEVGEPVRIDRETLAVKDNEPLPPASGVTVTQQAAVSGSDNPIDSFTLLDTSVSIPASDWTQDGDGRSHIRLPNVPSTTYGPLDVTLVRTIEDGVASLSVLELHAAQPAGGDDEEETTTDRPENTAPDGRTIPAGPTEDARIDVAVVADPRTSFEGQNFNSFGTAVQGGEAVADMVFGPAGAENPPAAPLTATAEGLLADLERGATSDGVPYSANEALDDLALLDSMYVWGNSLASQYAVEAYMGNSQLRNDHLDSLTADLDTYHEKLEELRAAIAAAPSAGSAPAS